MLHQEEDHCREKKKEFLARSFIVAFIVILAIAGIFRNQVKEKDHDLAAWKQVNRGTLSAAEYLELYPDGKYKKEALEEHRQETLEFQKVQNSNYSMVMQFLEKYPRSQYRAALTELIDNPDWLISRNDLPGLSAYLRNHPEKSLLRARAASALKRLCVTKIISEMSRPPYLPDTKLNFSKVSHSENGTVTLMLKNKNSSPVSFLITGENSFAGMVEIGAGEEKKLQLSPGQYSFSMISREYKMIQSSLENCPLEIAMGFILDSAVYGEQNFQPGRYSLNGTNKK